MHELIKDHIFKTLTLVLVASVSLIYVKGLIDDSKSSARESKNENLKNKIEEERVEECVPNFYLFLQHQATNWEGNPSNFRYLMDYLTANGILRARSFQNATSPSGIVSEYEVVSNMIDIEERSCQKPSTKAVVCYAMRKPVRILHVNRNVQNAHWDQLVVHYEYTLDHYHLWAEDDLIRNNLPLIQPTELKTAIAFFHLNKKSGEMKLVDRCNSNSLVPK